MASRDLFWRILKAMATTAARLELEGIEDHVYLQLVPDETVGYSVGRQGTVDVKFPAVLFSLDTEAERRGLEDTGGKGWIFPVRCWVADKNDLHRHDKLPVYLGARKGLFDAFDQKPLAGVAEAINVLVIPAVLFDPRLPIFQHIVSGFVIEVETEEDR